MKHLLETYLQSKQNAWAPSTIKSESARLRRLLDKEETPELLFERLTAEGYKPYSIKTAFIRLSRFYAEVKEGPNPYQDFLRRNRRLFMRAYQRKTVSTDFEVIKQQLETIPDPELRQHCLAMLRSGVRISESAAVKDGVVLGKGGKVRRVYNSEGLVPQIRAERVARALSKLGLKPHDLRKAFATKCARMGMDATTLCAVMGWSNINTAFYYLSPIAEEEIQSRLEVL